MRTQLQDFAHRFDPLVRPALAPLVAAQQALATASEAAHRQLHEPLARHCRELEALLEKVARQQAYVLIFGPLKSGKSTLMNAVAGSYVSEVSSLPAYPCLVFTGHGTHRDHTVTRYDGSEQRFADGAALHKHIHDAHRELAEAIRAAESAGEAFDPAEHFPRAVQRVDVRVTDSELTETGAVLVDTPGLYTRMRFGYDRMTREFRTAAACAVFVVKSDTLFLEQVFAEFEQLLELFSRIFLVVNVDSQKRDVAPDGSLVPSLEQSRPELVLDAFARLAMSAPLQRAAATGRLCIYPVDLLRAASAVLQRQPRDQQPTDFRRFRQDLHDYLASVDHLHAFLQDSLLRTQRVLQAAAQLAAEPTAALRDRADRMRARLQHAERDLAELDAVARRDLQPALQRARSQLLAETDRVVRDEGQKLLRALGASIDTWFLSGHSLAWLLQGHWPALLADHRRAVVDGCQRAAEHALSLTDAALDLPPDLAALLRRFALDPGRLRATATTSIGQLRLSEAAGVPVTADDIPVRRGALDVLTFRSEARIRHKVFGDDQKPDRKIPAKEKAQRLGEAGRLYLHQQVVQFRGSLMAGTGEATRRHFGDALDEATRQVLQRAVAAEIPPLQQAATEARAELAALEQVLAPLQAATAAVEVQLPGLRELARGFGIDLAVAPAPDPVLVPQPRRSAQDQGARGVRR